MKQIILIFTGFIIVETCLPSQAQQQPIPIRELKTPPAGLRAGMSQKCKSLRFGTCKIGPNKGELILHLYAVSLGRRVMPQERYDTPNPSQYKAIIFLSFLSRSGRNLHRLATIRLEETQERYATRNFLPFPTIMWLNPKQRRVPVIIKQVSGGGGFGGYWFLYIFAQGLNKKPIVQKFVYSHNLSQARNYLFNKTDNRGFMIVSEQYSTPYGTNTTTPYYWNGIKFTKTAQKK